MGSERAKAKWRLQYPLWVVLFAVPAVIACVIGYWSARSRMYTEREQLLAQALQLHNEARIYEQQATQIRLAHEWNETRYQHWQSPESVVRFIRSSSKLADFSNDVPRKSFDLSDLIFFFAQASDQDLRTLMDKLEAMDVEHWPQTRARRLEVLGMMPEQIPNRLNLVEQSARRLIEQDRSHLYPAVASQALIAWEAFEKAAPETTARSQSENVYQELGR